MEGEVDWIDARYVYIWTSIVLCRTSIIIRTLRLAADNTRTHNLRARIAKTDPYEV